MGIDVIYEMKWSEHILVKSSEVMDLPYSLMLDSSCSKPAPHVSNKRSVAISL